MTLTSFSLMSSSLLSFLTLTYASIAADHRSVQWSTQAPGNCSRKSSKVAEKLACIVARCYTL
jgi:hypothetical protein